MNIFWGHSDEYQTLDEFLQTAHPDESQTLDEFLQTAHPDESQTFDEFLQTAHPDPHHQSITTKEMDSAFKTEV